MIDGIMDYPKAYHARIDAASHPKRPGLRKGLNAKGHRGVCGGQPHPLIELFQQPRFASPGPRWAGVLCFPPRDPLTVKGVYR
jgi:hypothetical protein